ncbi:hypothetical protein KKG71_01180 [Patescibacteria group bacterium]|nr:hypothetical protein [Patescibacteria group bacterium]
MKRRIVKDFKTILKDMEPTVKNLKPLLVGREIENFSLRPREVWGNWLLCAVLQKIHNIEITFGDDNETDGIILNKVTGGWIQTEHVSALDVPTKNHIPKGEERIIQAINKKIDKGPEYAKNKILVVFFDGAGKWYRNKVRESINGRHNFMSIFAIGLLTSDKNGYAYSITDFYENSSISYKVTINSSFSDWFVTKMN